MFGVGPSGWRGEDGEAVASDWSKVGQTGHVPNRHRYGSTNINP